MSDTTTVAIGPSDSVGDEGIPWITLDDFNAALRLLGLSPRGLMSLRIAEGLITAEYAEYRRVPRVPTDGPVDD